MVRVVKKAAKSGETSLVKKEKEEALSAKDLKALDEAVSFINARIDNASVSVIEIGQFLLDKFFSGNIEKAQDRAPRKGLSLRKLAEHPDVNMSFAGLSNAVNLAVQEKTLAGVKASEQLTPSHKVLLLKVENLEEKKKFIAQVVKDNLSVRKLQDILEQAGHVKMRGLAAVANEAERKRLRSGFQQYLDPFEHIISMKLEKLFDMPSRDIKAAYVAAQKANERLQVILKELAKHMS